MSRTYGELRYGDGRFEIKCEPHVMIRLKRIFPKANKFRTGIMALKDTTETAADIRWVVARWPMVMDDVTADHLFDQADRYDKAKEQVLSILGGNVPHMDLLELAIPLRDYQEEASALVHTTGRLLLVDDLGLGKSASGIGVLRAPGALPALVVTLTHLPPQWQGEVAKFLPGLRTHIVKKGTPYDVSHRGEDPDVLIMNYAKLAGWRSHLAGRVRTVIFDEMQELRRDGTDKYQGADEIAFAATYRVGLSVGPETQTEMRGGPFGAGWMGPIEAAMKIGAESVLAVGDYEIGRAGGGVEARGWTGRAFGWKRVKNFVRHPAPEMLTSISASTGVTRLTAEHSIYEVGPVGLELVEAGCLEAGARLAMDNGAAWDAIEEQLVDVAATADNQGVTNIQVVVDLAAVTREDLGVTAWQWQNFNREAIHGSRLPLEVYRSHRDRLPTPTAVYTSAGRGGRLAPELLRLSELAYFLGFYLGDGWVEGHRIGLAVELPLVDRMLVYLRNDLGSVIPDVDPSVSERGKGSVEIRFCHPMLAAVLRSELHEHRCWEKSIPGDWITSWPDEARLALLQGLIDSDGHVAERQGRRWYTTTSPDLASSLQSLLRSLGSSSSLSRSEPRSGGSHRGRAIVGRRDRFDVNWSAHQPNPPTPRHGPRSRHSWGRGLLFESAVRSVSSESSGCSYVYDLEMDGHPSFVANGLLVHNTATPIYNYGGEIYNVISVLDHDALGNREEFNREWGTGSGAKIAVNDPAALGSYLREEGLMLRRSRADVKRELPEVQRLVYPVALDSEHLEKATEGAEALAKMILEASGTPTELWRASGDFDWRLRHATGVAKARYVADFVRLLLETGEPVVLWGWHRDCFAPGTMILMANGASKRVEDVAEGDEVMGPDSQPRRVRALVSGYGNLYQVTPNKGEPWICSENHILTVWNGRREETVTAREFAERGQDWQRKRFLYRAGVTDFGVTARVPEPWFVGFWLGDGAADLHDVRVCSADAEVVVEVEAVAQRYGLSVRRWAARGATGRCKAEHLCLSAGPRSPYSEDQNELRIWMRSLGLHRNKHIPPSYLVAPVEDRRQLLAGLIDADGHVCTGNGVGTAVYTTVSRVLAEGVAFVARSLGFAAYVKEKTTGNSGYGPAGVPYLDVSISGDLTSVPTRIARKAGAMRAGQKEVLRTGFSVTPAGRGNYFGFEVDGDHRFLLADFTVVHNCYSIWMERLRDHRPALYTGSESPTQKLEAEKRFKDGDTNLLIMSLRSGAGLEGLQERCHVGVFGELDWSPGVHAQGIGRLHRDGMDEPVVAYFLVAEEGSDPAIAEVLDLKRQQSQGIVDPGMELFTAMPPQTDRMKLLAQSFLDTRKDGGHGRTTL